MASIWNAMGFPDVPTGQQNIQEFIFKDALYADMKFSQFLTIAMHAIQWEGILPVGLESEDIERMLIQHQGIAMFSADEGIFLLPFRQEGGLNIYGKPEAVAPVPVNGVPITVIPNSPTVILWDNPVHKPFGTFLLEISLRLADIQLSISVAEEHARIPAIIAMDNEMKIDGIMRAITKRGQGYPIIPVDLPTANNIASGIVSMNMGFNADVIRILWEDYAKVEAEAYRLIGTPFNLEQNKASGVGAAETIVNLSDTLAFAHARLKQRERFAEQVNSLYKGVIDMHPRLMSNPEELIIKALQGDQKLADAGKVDDTAKEASGDERADAVDG